MSLALTPLRISSVEGPQWYSLSPLKSLAEGYLCVSHSGQGGWRTEGLPVLLALGMGVVYRVKELFRLEKTD